MINFSVSGFALRFGILVIALGCANAPVRAEASSPLQVRDVKAPKSLIQKQGKSKILRSVVANLGAERESCWGLWTTRGKTGVSFAVWKPTGKTSFTRLGIWKISMPVDDVEGAEMAWLNSKTQQGWVMSWWSGWGVANVLAFPQGVRTPAKSLVSDEFSSSSTSISATNHRLDSGSDPRGFYAITEVYSEPGQDEQGNTITLEETTDYFWNGKGWSVPPKEPTTGAAPKATP